MERSLRYRKFEVTGDPGYENATKDGMPVWFYRTKGERRYGRRLRIILNSPPRVLFGVVQAETDFLCLCARLPVLATLAV